MNVINEKLSICCFSVETQQTAKAPLLFRISAPSAIQGFSQPTVKPSSKAKQGE